MHERLLTREEFFDLVWTKPMVQLAKEFGLSDVGLAKACKRHNIPRPDRGYWAKRAVGKAPKRPALPPRPLGAQEIRFSIPPPVAERKTDPELASWIERENDPANKILVPDTVHRYHALVRATKDYRSGRGPADGALAIHVSSDAMPRVSALERAPCRV